MRNNCYRKTKRSVDALFAIRKAFGLPPAFLTIVIVLALVLFSPEIFRFMVLRAKVQRLRAGD